MFFVLPRFYSSSLHTKSCLDSSTEVTRLRLPILYSVLFLVPMVPLLSVVAVISLGNREPAALSSVVCKVCALCCLGLFTVFYA